MMYTLLKYPNIILNLINCHDVHTFEIFKHHIDFWNYNDGYTFEISEHHIGDNIHDSGPLLTPQYNQSQTPTMEFASEPMIGCTVVSQQALYIMLVITFISMGRD